MKGSLDDSPPGRDEMGDGMSQMETPDPKQCPLDQGGRAGAGGGGGRALHGRARARGMTR